ncbi:MAG: inorganic phosphate transporter [Rhodospirillales bacterium]|nr:inorganic phosphate transporter [Rhodospirillales bacterium]MBO6785957.1 inorganic phosphate transporter [Rhodospirillales bacterium]
MNIFNKQPKDPNDLKAQSLDKDLKRIVQLEKATKEVGTSVYSLGTGLFFLLGVWAYTYIHSGGEASGVLIAAAVIGGYMAMNIGANDVANNVGPAVGSKALSMVGALAIAAVFEAAGAMIAGGEVVSTISKGIISTETIASVDTFIWAMMAALLSAALWVNLATFLGAPVSTTHSIVGGVMGAGIAAAGINAVNWPVMSAIAASWVVSPVLGGIIAAAFLLFIKWAILFRQDKIAAARRWVPVLVAIMASVFAAYLMIKGLKRIWKPDLPTILAVAAGVFAVTYFWTNRIVAKASVGLENKRKSVAKLFTVPLICSAALLSFAHGSNDVANAVGPLAAIVSAIDLGEISTKAALPFWVLLIGALGISVGLALFGPKIIKLVGEKITKLNQVRAFCVALSAAITVIIASALGLPVSSTHIAIGAVFGVGFAREAVTNRGGGGVAETGPLDPDVLADIDEGKLFKSWRKYRKRRLVRRQHMFSIAAAWVVTVPASALLAAILYFCISWFN